MRDKRMSKKETDMVYFFECIVKGEISQKGCRAFIVKSVPSKAQAAKI
jgi:hypothetical protein